MRGGPMASSLIVEEVALGQLRPYERNARTHSPAQVEQVAASVRAFGWTNPLLIDEAGLIIAGHGRLAAAKLLGLASVPCIRLLGLSDTQKRALAIADNKLALNAGWDDALLAAELQSLGDLQGLVGFSDDELVRLFKGHAGLTDPDEAPEAPADPVSTRGDVWLLGAHRLICGDSTDKTTVARLMTGARADLLFTSPPYLQQRDYDGAKGMPSDWNALMQGVFSTAPVGSGGQVLVNLGMIHRGNEWLPYWDGWVEWMRNVGWRRFGLYVWDQGFGLPGDWNGRLAPSFELIFHFNREALRANKIQDKKPENIGGQKACKSTMRSKDGTLKDFSSPEACGQSGKIPDSVIRVTRQKGKIGGGLDHPAVFPVALVEEVMGAYSTKGGKVFEPFCGSGTQIIAAENLGRLCYAIEINPAYVDVAVTRWQNFTGNQATDEAGAPFDEVAAQRRAKAA